jgi:hypothetical protein
MQIKHFFAFPLFGLVMMCCLWDVAPALADPDRVTVRAIGSSRVRAQDMQATREEAVGAGLVNAVSRVLIDTVPQELVAGRFALLAEVALTRTDRYVRDYRVLTEATQVNTYHVLLEASVSIPQLKAALSQAGLALEKADTPRVLFCIAEKRIEELTERYWWSGQHAPEEILVPAILAQQAATRGYRSLSPQASSVSTAYAADLTAPEAVALAEQLEAEVVIVGRAVAEEAPNTMAGSLKAFRGRLVISAYRVDTGERIAHVEQVALTGGTDAETGGRDALVKVAGLAADALFRQIGIAGIGGAAKGRVELAVEGTRGNIADFVRFRNVLSTMSGVENIQLKEMLPDRALISIAYQGGARALADALLLQNYETFGISILETSPFGIRLQLQPR